jgi:hypothetical protein
MAHNRRDDDLAYGDYHGDAGAEGDRGLIGDMGRRLFGGGRKEVRSFWFHYLPTKRHSVMAHPARITCE